MTQRVPTECHLARTSEQLTGTDDPIPQLAAAATIASTVTVAAVTRTQTRATSDAAAVDLREALVLLHWVQGELAAIQTVLISAARRAGVSWQTLPPALGVASRRAAQRRYLRMAPAAAGNADSTGDERVLAEPDRRAGCRAVDRWANNHTADLRRLAGQITGLTDLDDAAAPSIDRLHHALADASTCPRCSPTRSGIFVAIPNLPTTSTW